MKKEYLVTKEIQNGRTTSWSMETESARLAIELSSEVTQEMINTGEWKEFEDGTVMMMHGYVNFEAHEVIEE